MSKAHHLKTRESKAVIKTLPLNFLLGCGQTSLGDFALARLNEVANLRSELKAVLDRMMDQMAQAAIAEWFKAIDRQALKHAIENEESPEEWAHRMMRDGQRSEEELIPLPSFEPGAAHLAAALRYQERNIAEGKCSVCPEPLDRNSVRYCSKHLAMKRDRERQKKGLRSDPGSREYLYSGDVTPSTRGRQPGTLASLEMNREKKTRALLAELGIPPESAAVSLKAAKDALLRVIPDSQAKAMSPADLFRAAIVPSRTTGDKALRELLAAGRIQRIGKPTKNHPFRYFTTERKDRQT